MKILEIIVIMFLSFISTAQYSVPAPIFPLEMKWRHISETQTGLVMACFSFGSLIAPALMTGWIYQWYGRRGAVQLGILVLALALLFYAISYFIPDRFKLLFVILSGMTRFMEGLGSTGSLTAFISLISKIYPEEVALALTAWGIGSSTGICLGIIIGSLLFSLIGYFGVFLILSIVTFLTIFFILIFKESYNGEGYPNGELSLTYSHILKPRWTVMVLLGYFCSAYLFYSLEPTLALKLRGDFHFS